MTTCPVSHDFDPFGPAFQADPGAALRRQGPVFYSSVLDWYVVTRYEDIRAVSGDTESFSSRNFSDPVVALCPAARAKLEEHGFKRSASLGSTDEPVHSQRRKLMHEPYKPKSALAWEGKIREVHTAYIDAFVERGGADLVRDYFWEAPAVVALEFMGIPEEDVAQVKQFAVGVMTFIFGHPTDDEQIETCDFMGRHQRYARELVSRLLEGPDGPGLIQHAIRNYHEHPDTIDEDFLVSQAVNTLSAAHETTSASLANALLLLLRHRNSWEALCTEPELIPGAVEECLRLAPSLTTNRRLCVSDTVIGGVRIPAGAKVLLGVASANRDAAVFDHPDDFDIRRRTAKRHLTFGYGAHFCLGAPLARVQMRIALEELTRRLPSLRLVPDQTIEYVPTVSARAPRALHVVWD